MTSWLDKSVSKSDDKIHFEKHNTLFLVTSTPKMISKLTWQIMLQCLILLKILFDVSNQSVINNNGNC